jgi:hypothetical protein
VSDDPVSGVFGRPFTEQVAFFRRKLGNLVPTEFWDDMLREEHDRGFMVAGAAKADLLMDLAAAVDKAIAEGRGIEEFRRDFDAIVRRHGWTGWTGQGTVQGEAWRVKTILRTNSYTSYAAGRLAQLRASNFKWWIYRHGGSQEPRPQHLDWDGLMLPPDHPFWDKFYPPSDWGCSCYVVGANSNAAARRMGGKPDKKLPDSWDRIDPKTGAPEGIGRGWDYAPGASVSGEVSAIAGKIRLWDRMVGKAFMADLPPGRADVLADAYRSLPSTADDARRFAQRVAEGSADGDAERRPLTPHRTLGLLRSDQVSQINRLIDDDVEGYDFSIDAEGAANAFRQYSGDAAKRRRSLRAISPADFALLPMILSKPDLVEPSGATDAGEPLLRFIKRIGGETFIAEMAVRGGARQTLALNTFFIRVSGSG